MKRRYDLDWLRVLAFALLMLFHTGMLFSTWGWHVKNLETSPGFDTVMRFLHEWRMPLLFFISGSAVWFALERYSAWQFFLERHKRLLVPLIAGMLIVIPPQVYYERLYHYYQYDSFWDFYRTLFTGGSYPEGNLSWHHLWYIPYIWTYSMLGFPIFLALRTPTGRRVLAALMRQLEKPWLLCLLFVPSALAEIALRPYWSSDENNLFADWANFAHKTTFFLAGFALASAPAVYDVLAKHRRKFLLGALGLLAVMEPVWTFGAKYLPGPAYWVVHNLHIWLWLLTVLGYGRQHLNFNHPVLRHANDAVYPFYILHQTVIIILGYYLVPVNWSLGVKFLVVVAGTFALCTALYIWVIRPWNFLRVLFGLKWNRHKSAAETAPTAARPPTSPRPTELEPTPPVVAWLEKRGAAMGVLGLALIGAVALMPRVIRQGELEAPVITAPSLAGNRLGVSERQMLAVYLPPSYRASQRRYPVLYFLPNFRNFLWQYTGGDYQKFRLRAAMDELVASGAAQEMVVVIPNATHFLGGSLYRNSPLTGNWEDYVTRDVVSFVDTHYRTIPEARARGLAGNGIGGTGALEIALKHPDIFSCVGAMCPALFDGTGLRDIGLPDPRLSQAWQTQLQTWQNLPEPERHRRFRDFIQPLVFSFSRARFFDGLRLVYAAALTPDLHLPYPHIAFPATATNAPGNAALLAAYENGFGGWPAKIAQYQNLCQARSLTLRRIVLEYAKEDEHAWIPRGTVALAATLRERGISCELIVSEGRHESRLGPRLKTVMLPAMSQALTGEIKP